MNLQKFPYTEEDEKITRSQYSPGCVKDEEILIRLFYHPENFSPNNVLLPSAISSEDLIKRGVSLFREDYSGTKVITNVVKQHQGNKPVKRKECFLSKTVCKTIRNICDTKGRAVVVIDTPTRNNKGHCSIYSLPRTKGEIKKIQTELAIILGKSIMKY